MIRKPKRAVKSRKRAKPRRKSSPRKVARKLRTKPRRKSKSRARPKAKPKRRPASRRVSDVDFDRFVARILRVPAAPRAKSRRFQPPPSRACAICGEPTDHGGDGHPYEIEEKE